MLAMIRLLCAYCALTLALRTAAGSIALLDRRVARCQHTAKFDPILSLDCAGVEGVGAQSKERMGSNFAA